MIDRVTPAPREDPTPEQIETAREVLIWLYEREETHSRLLPMISDLRDALEVERVLLS